MLCPAIFTYEVDAFSNRFALLVAFGAFVANSAKTVGAKVLANVNAAFLLPAEIVEGKFPEYYLGDFLRAFFGNLLT